MRGFCSSKSKSQNLEVFPKFEMSIQPFPEDLKPINIFLVGNYPYSSKATAHTGDFSQNQILLLKATLTMLCVS
jgi:hypothetical protein